MIKGGGKNRLSDVEAVVSPEVRIRQQVDGIERFLNLRFRARVLDLGCGGGAQTLELARRKYRVLGMDGSSRGLTSARHQARTEKLTAHFMVNDMRRIPYEGEFEAAINIRNPVGCYRTEKEDRACLQSVHKSLKPGGKLLLDLLNRECLIRSLWPLSEGKETPFNLRSGRLDCQGFTARGGRAPYASGSMRIYSLVEIIRILGESGFTFRQAWGAYDGRLYDIDSMRMIVVAEKVQSKPARRRKDDGLPRAVRIKGRPK